MTKEQIELEFAHIELDRAQKNGNNQVYEDDSYDDYDKESDNMDERLSDMPTFNGVEANPEKLQEDIQPPKSVETIDESEWEDVEIDDFEPSEED